MKRAGTVPRLRWCVLAVAAGLGAVQDVAAQADAPQRPRYQTLREEEDWSVLRDPALRTDVWDRLKYVPAGESSYLSLGAEVRPFYERFANELWGEAPRDGDGFVLNRVMLHADLHAGPRVRLFTQLKSGLAWGRVGGPRPADRNDVDVNQLFLELGAGRLRGPGGPPLAVRFGRQEMEFGAGRMVAPREGPNVRVGFDGARSIVRSAGWRADAFAMRPVETDPGAFDDGRLEGEWLWGVYGASPRVLPGGVGVDVYYLGRDRDLAVFDQGAAAETRHTLGTRLWREGAAAGFDLEAAYQLGDAGPGAIRAWTLGGSATWRVRGAPLRPELGLHAGAASGDRDPAGADLQTFVPPAPRGSYFGQSSPLGPSNIQGVNPRLALQPHPRVGVTLDALLFWRQSTRDAVYGVPGNLVRTGQQSRARYIGSQWQAEARWILDSHATLVLQQAYFRTGAFLRETPPGRSLHYSSAHFRYHF